MVYFYVLCASLMHNTSKEGFWPLQVATVQRAPYFDNIQRVLIAVK